MWYENLLEFDDQKCFAEKIFFISYIRNIWQQMTLVEIGFLIREVESQAKNGIQFKQISLK